MVESLGDIYQIFKLNSPSLQLDNGRIGVGLVVSAAIKEEGGKSIMVAGVPLGCHPRVNCWDVGTAFTITNDS